MTHPHPPALPVTPPPGGRLLSTRLCRHRWVQRQHAGDESRCAAVLKPQGARRRAGAAAAAAPDRATGGGRFLRASVGGTNLPPNLKMLWAAMLPVSCLFPKLLQGLQRLYPATHSAFSELLFLACRVISGSAFLKFFCGALGNMALI